MFPSRSIRITSLSHELFRMTGYNQSQCVDLATLSAREHPVPPLQGLGRGAPPCDSHFLTRVQTVECSNFSTDFKRFCTGWTSSQNRIEPSHFINNYLENVCEMLKYSDVVNGSVETTYPACLIDPRLPSPPGRLGLLASPGFSYFCHNLEWSLRTTVLFLIRRFLSPSHRIGCHRTKLLKYKNIQRVQRFLFLFHLLSEKNTSLSSRQSKFFKRIVFNKAAPQWILAMTCRKLIEPFKHVTSPVLKIYFLILIKDDGFFNHKLSLVLFKCCKCHQHKIYCSGLLKREANTEFDWACCGMACRVIYSCLKSD